MPTEPQIEILSYKRRQMLFLTLVLVFLVALPTMIFYTTGYRLNFDNEATSIVTTGGMYVTTDNLEVDVYLDQEHVEKPRLFRSAYYIQNIEAGQHRVVVQRPDLQTWVKELPVDPYIVIETSAFNMPIVPHIRPVTQYVTPTNQPVVLGVATPDSLFAGVTTTVPVYATTSRNTTWYEENEEYLFVQSLFSTTSTSSQSVFDRFINEVERFRFATATPVQGTEVATTTEEVVARGSMHLVERAGEIYAVWHDSVSTIPYYFCVTDEPLIETAQRYGQHVADAIALLALSTTTPVMVDGERLCRPEIKLNHLRQDVYYYGFFPNSSDLVLLHLEDGLYVTEVDDRSWQNTQQIYPGADFQVVVENDKIFIHDGDRYFELVTTIEPL